MHCHMGHLHRNAGLITRMLDVKVTQWMTKNWGSVDEWKKAGMNLKERVAPAGWGPGYWGYMVDLVHEGEFSLYDDEDYADGFLAAIADNGKTLLHSAAEMHCSELLDQILELAPHYANYITDPALTEEEKKNKNLVQLNH